MESGIGPLRRTFTGELPLGIFPFSAKRKDPGGVREIAGQILFPEPFQGFRQAIEIGQGNLGNLEAGQGFAVKTVSESPYP